MCEWFDLWWKLLLGIAFLLSVGFMLVQLGVFGLTWGKAGGPHGYRHLRLWAMGVVALIVLLLFAFGLFCAGSPGDFPAVVPE